MSVPLTLRILFLQSTMLVRYNAMILVLEHEDERHWEYFSYEKQEKYQETIGHHVFTLVILNHGKVGRLDEIENQPIRVRYRKHSKYHK